MLLCSPRGFCAGVVRAIDSVEQALKRYGAPVYVRHEIVHNRYVVESLKAKGAIFVEELVRNPGHQGAGDLLRPRRAEIDSRGIASAAISSAFDATCPLVTKVHREAEIHHKRGREIVLIGHAGHPEVVGTLGQLPDGAITLVQTVEEAEAFQPRDPSKLAYVTQTTLSLDDTADIVARAQAPLPRRSSLRTRRTSATPPPTARRRSSAWRRRSMRWSWSARRTRPIRGGLQEVAERAGCPYSVLVQRAAEIDWSKFDGIKTLGVTAGASAPEVLVEEILDAFAARYTLNVETVSGADESGMFFPLPRQLRDNAAA